MIKVELVRIGALKRKIGMKKLAKFQPALWFSREKFICEWTGFKMKLEVSFQIHSHKVGFVIDGLMIRNDMFFQVEIAAADQFSQIFDYLKRIHTKTALHMFSIKVDSIQ